MRIDIALGAAVAASFAYVLAFGVSSSRRPNDPITNDRPMTMLVNFAESGQILRITDPTQVATVSSWLDAAFENPRSTFDLRFLPPPINELEVEFESGDRRTIYFSGRTASNARDEFLRQINSRDDVYVVQFEGASYTIDGVPQILEGFLELSEHRYQPKRPRRYGESLLKIPGTKEPEVPDVDVEDD